MHGSLNNYPVIIDQAVAWGDLDMHGHVNNVWIFRYIENARIAYYERIDKYNFERRSGVSFVLAATECKFILPLTYPGSVKVGARVSEIATDRMMMDYRIVIPTRDQVAVKAAATLVSFNYTTNQKAPFPDELKTRIEDLQKACEI